MLNFVLSLSKAVLLFEDDKNNLTTMIQILGVLAKLSRKHWVSWNIGLHIWAVLATHHKTGQTLSKTDLSGLKATCEGMT